KDKTFLDSPTPGFPGHTMSPMSRQLLTPEHSVSSLPTNDAEDLRVTVGAVAAHRLTPTSSHRHSADARIPIPGACGRGGYPSARHDGKKRPSEDVYEASSSRSSLVNDKGFGDGAPRSLASID